MLQVEIMLGCGEILTVPLENALHLPKKGEEVVCAVCRTLQPIVKVGIPFRVEDLDQEVPVHKDQKTIGGVK